MEQRSNRPRVRKAVLPVAGLGTRFIPATKAIPKEMLPVVDRPAIQYIVEEVADVGIDEVLFVTGAGKSAIEDHFDRNLVLEAALQAKGDADRLAQIRRITELVSVHSTRQGEALGLGHAVLQGREHVGDEPFAVLLGDDLIDARDELLATMLAVQQELGGSVVALLEVDPEHAGRYGIATVEPASVPGVPEGDVVRVLDTVEKPDPADAPSNLALIGRYVLSPEIFEVLAATPPGRGGEIQLTDALQTLARRPDDDGGGVHGVIFRGRRYDTGDKLDYLKAVVQLAVDREDLGADFAAWLEQFVAGRHVELSSDPASSLRRRD